MIFNKNLGNIIISSTPGFISIFLSFFTIPIYLNYLGFEKYGNFLILHILLSVVMITNFNLGKIASIKMQKVLKKNKSSIISTTIVTSIISSALVCLLLYLFYIILISLNNNLILNNYKILFFALFFSNVYVTLENISKGLKYYFLSSFGNLIFYSLSLSLPALFILLDFNIYQDVATLFNISLCIKIFGILVIFFTLIYKKYIELKFSPQILKDFLDYGKWQTLSSAYIQIFDFFDKYLIKIFLGAASLSTYSIPQQIAGKLSVISDGLISVFIPKISSSKNKKKTFEILNSNFYSFFYLIGFLLILINPFINEVLIWWLRVSANLEILFLFKIFLMISFYICITHIISTFLDTQKLSKKNSQIETFVLVVFVIGLIISVYYKNINFFAYTMLIRSLIAFFIKAFYIKKFLINFNILILQNIIFILIFLFSINENFQLFYFLSGLFLLLLLFYFPKEIIKKEFLK
ncbi:oligosaccharide flippase family protein [Candidatus Pelagibacter sp. HIMB1506]|uniref:oligosaccharide flippase family protein n=1 Tax=Candidatus Pelagibacter sp. HIMB1506 TaxID=3413337 RepID=UPI003F869154